jgi:hypothetical protein
VHLRHGAVAPARRGGRPSVGRAADLAHQHWQRRRSGGRGKERSRKDGRQKHSPRERSDETHDSHSTPKRAAGVNFLIGRTKVAHDGARRDRTGDFRLWSRIGLES